MGKKFDKFLSKLGIELERARPASLSPLSRPSQPLAFSEEQEPRPNLDKNFGLAGCFVFITKEKSPRKARK